VGSRIQVQLQEDGGGSTKQTLDENGLRSLFQPQAAIRLKSVTFPPSSPLPVFLILILILLSICSAPITCST